MQSVNFLLGLMIVLMELYSSTNYNFPFIHYYYRYSTSIGEHSSNIDLENKNSILKAVKDFYRIQQTNKIHNQTCYEYEYWYPNHNNIYQQDMLQSNESYVVTFTELSTIILVVFKNNKRGVNIYSINQKDMFDNDYFQFNSNVLIERIFSEDFDGLIKDFQIFNNKKSFAFFIVNGNRTQFIVFQLSFYSGRLSTFRKQFSLQDGTIAIKEAYALENDYFLLRYERQVAIVMQIGNDTMKLQDYYQPGGLQKNHRIIKLIPCFRSSYGIFQYLVIYIEESHNYHFVKGDFVRLKKDEKGKNQYRWATKHSVFKKNISDIIQNYEDKLSEIIQYSQLDDGQEFYFIIAQKYHLHMTTSYLSESYISTWITPNNDDIFLNDGLKIVKVKLSQYGNYALIQTYKETTKIKKYFLLELQHMKQQRMKQISFLQIVDMKQFLQKSEIHDFDVLESFQNSQNLISILFILKSGDFLVGDLQYPLYMKYQAMLDEQKWPSNPQQLCITTAAIIIGVKFWLSYWVNDYNQNE